jgi:hypothetical protein
LRGRFGNFYGRGYRRNKQFYGYYAPVVVDKYDYTQDELLVQLRSLAQARAGLYAEWKILREEANRAVFGLIKKRNIFEFTMNAD